ncbi:hypothetical protein IGI04_000329 [Brassica rapa subsp. trilocularis]|uniref:Amidase domain-containing protein n=1 Tax=Brassica rapa subsp. trilocularis TaxID=1813537 RepID=A0ABQ7NPF9_BRACM|nr:hypothetical protein IGI04_000329 [Brassica rapa subsp. trilocularis]
MLTSTFSIQEATIQDIRLAFNEKRLTSKQLVEFYLEEISNLNPILFAVIETNPDALIQAEKADREREVKDVTTELPFLHGVPILLKDLISTKDKLNTTAGSLALFGSVVPRDAGVVKRLRDSGAVILGKASLSEWAHFRSFAIPSGWSARGLQGKNPYVLTADPCGSSSGSAISVAANLVAVSLGTETDGSILCPSSQNSVVGFKPTVGLTSRGGVVPVSLRQDSVGREGATVIEDLSIPNMEVIKDWTKSGERTALLAEFKMSLNAYLKDLVKSPVRSLADVIAYNEKFAEENVITEMRKKKTQEKVEEWGQELFLAAEATNGMGKKERAALQKMEELSRNGLEKLMKEKELDAIVSLGSKMSNVLAIGGYPGINVPAGYDSEGVPFGITFGGKPPKFKAQGTQRKQSCCYL